MEVDDEPKQTRTVLASRIDLNSSVAEIRELFTTVGPLKKCFLVRDSENGQFTGVAYITFETPSDALRAVETLNGKLFNSKQIGVKFSKDKGKPSTKLEPVPINEDVPHVYYPRISSTQRNKRGRIIIRNLHFNVTVDKLKDFFKPYGIVKDASILKKPDGKSKGVGFVQFKEFLDAQKAIQECHTKVLFGRAMSIDLAIPKNEYEQKNNPESNLDPMEMFRKSLKGSSPEPATVKEEENSAELPNQSENDNDVIMEQDDEITDEKENELGGDSGIEGEDEEYDAPQPNKPKITTTAPSKDVSEGRSIFVKNISLDADKDAVKERFSKYGEVNHVYFCIDHQTERFKGTGFIEFKDWESATACLEAFNDPACKKDFIIESRSVFIMRAISRDEINRKQSKKDSFKEKKDARNIYLAKEGAIREGTLAARGVSKRDLGVRTQREIIKRKLLGNLNTFVSPTRLFIQNLPLSLMDNQLKDIFRINSPKDSKITETRIMRNLYDIDGKGSAKSKGHAFVTFTKHSDALHALRAINNNPTIFSDKQRPIVEFAIENRSALVARQNRLLKSNVQKKSKNGIPAVSKEELGEANSADFPAYSGSKYDPKKKGFKALSSHVGPKIRDRNGKGKITRNAINNSTRRMLANKNNRMKPKNKRREKKTPRNSKAKQSKSRSGRSTKKINKKSHKKF